MKDLSEIRISRVRAFSECPRYAVASLSIPWDGRMHVATWIGTAVHNHLVGWPPEEKPENLIYDKVTTTAERADESVEKILGGIAEFDEQYKPQYLKREVAVQTVSGATKLTGHIDALARIDGKLVLIDLKTGRSPYTVWVQTAMYAWLAEEYFAGARQTLAPDEDEIRNAEEGEPLGIGIEALGHLHVPRVGPRTEQRWSYEQRDLEHFAHDIQQWCWMLDQWSQAGYHELPATPGMHCSRCPIEDCAVRGAEQKKD